MTESKYRERAAELVKAHQSIFGLGSAPASALTERIAVFCAQVAQESAPKGCTWTLSPDPDCEYWDTDCGRSFAMLDATPKENDYDFCPGCGGKITEIVPPPPTEE